jgi:hypothetical protein
MRVPLKPWSAFMMTVVTLMGQTTTRVDYPTQVKNGPLFSDAGPVGSTLASLCQNAGSGTLAITQKWLLVSTQTISCSIQPAGGIIQPALGQHITISGSISGPIVQLFDCTVAGPGCVIITGPNAAMYTGWFGDKYDGATDSTAAWNATLGACSAVGCNIAIPSGANSYSSTGLIFDFSAGTYIRVTGGGLNSRISCATSITCVQWTGGTGEFQDSGMENLQISIPVANSSSVGLFIGGGSVDSNTRLYFKNVKVIGDSSLKLGIGIWPDNTVLPRFQNVIEQYFNTGELQTGFVNSWWSQCGFVSNGTNGADVNSSGESQFHQCDFEGNGATGLLVDTDANNVSVIQSHFESNTTNQIHIAGGELVLSDNNQISGGTVLVDSGGVIISTADSWSSVTLTNNSTGALGNAGVQLTLPVITPSLSTSSTGVTQLTDKLGVFNFCYSAGVQVACANTYTFNSASAYGFDNVTTSRFNRSVNGNPQFLATDTNPAATSACYGFSGTFIGANQPTICWDSANGGLSFFPSPASTTIGTNDYTFFDGAGALIGLGTDPGLFSFVNVSASGASAAVPSGQVGFGSTIVAASNCGSLSGSTGCLKIYEGATPHYVPVY